MALADTDTDGVYSEAELDTLTKVELLDLANKLGVEGVSSNNTKTQIITTILANQEANADITDADANSDGSYSEEELNALNVVELLKLAKSLNVEGVNTKSTKVELISAIMESQTTE